MKSIAVKEIIAELDALGNPANVAGMRRFGIATKQAFGVAAPELKLIAKEIKKQTDDCHRLALELWATAIHEARIVAYLIDDSRRVTSAQMEAWAADFDNWAICDGTGGHLFRKTKLAYEKAFEWSERDEEFVKRAGIVLAAWLAVHDKKAANAKIARFLPVLEKHSGDERNFIKKAVSWSLRQIGKRNLILRGLAVEAAERIKLQNTKPARWIAADVLRELTNGETIRRIGNKSKN